MSLSANIRRNRINVRNHDRAARATIGGTYFATMAKANTPGIPVLTGNLRRGERQNFDAVRGSWPLGKDWRSFNDEFYAAIIALGRHMSRAGKMLGSLKNRLGHLVTGDEEAQKAFRAWRFGGAR